MNAPASTAKTWGPTAKTWGPFTGRQLTTIIVALIIGAVVVPSTVWAVDSFTNVAIMDPVSGVKAKVDAGRKLTVGDGAGNLTVDGCVLARPANPVDFKRYYQAPAATGPAPRSRPLRRERPWCS